MLQNGLVLWLVTDTIFVVEEMQFFRERGILIIMNVLNFRHQIRI